MTQLATPADFYAAIRSGLFADKMSQDQVDGCNALLTACGTAGWDPAWTAYALATAFHETMRTMQPVREAYWLSEAWRQTHLAYFPYYGRGYVQLTHLVNYQRADKVLGLNGALLANLDLAMQPDIAARIMISGMAAGWFSGKSLKDYLPYAIGTAAQFTEARWVINGTDKTVLIAAEAGEFQTALSAGGWA